MSKKLCWFFMALFTVCMALVAQGAPSDTDTSCDIDVTVDSIMEWKTTSFGPINLSNITAVADTQTGSAQVTLWTNGDVNITADNSDTAQLASTSTADVLDTDYRISDDGDGSSDTGGLSTSWQDYDAFLSTAGTITHVNTDGNAVLTLEVRANASSNAAPDAQTYEATQTLTASWAGS